MKAIFSPTIPLTILIEGIVLLLWSLDRTSRRKKFLSRLLVLSIANILTQLILIAALTISPFPYWPTLLIMDIIIVIIEAEILGKTSLSRKQSIKLSLLLNIISFGIGLLLPI